ncbi:ribonuclease R [bacterium]|nr:ribonuclease R [bacterium]
MSIKQTETEKSIIDFLNAYSGVTFSSRELLRKLDIPRSYYRELRGILKGLAREKRIERVGKRTYRMKKTPHLVVGIISMTKHGYGFIKTEEREIFIPPGKTGTAMDGDSVKVEVYAGRRGKSLEGEIVEIVERKHKKIIGTYMEAKSIGYVIPDDKKFTRDLYIVKGKSKKAKPGDKVVAECTKWESEHRNPEGIIKEVLGDPSKPGIDMAIVRRLYDITGEFPEQVKKEIKDGEFAIPKKEYKRRKDLRNNLIFTIDPEDARDFDDAVSLEKLSNGNYYLSVHIADVSFYVRENTVVDKEAFNRATSVYFPDKCIPMLPRKLSENICSLKPDEDRLVFSVFMEITPEGELVNYEIAESVIKSVFRLTYKKAQKILDKKQDSDVGRMLLLMSDLADILKKERMKNGSLDFDLPEVMFSFDPFGVIQEIKKKQKLKCHDIVEEFMLMANKSVTEYIDNKSREQRGKIPFIYRIHDKPSKEKTDEYVKFLKVMRLHSKEIKRPTPKIFQRVLDKVKGQPEERIVSEITLRTMMKAEYSPGNKGHFGLAFKRYTHFTSPIRRYPDLVVHRILKSCLNNSEKEYSQKMERTLSSICKHSSEMERKAVEAEREAIKIKQLEYMLEKVGEEYAGVISGVMHFGLFIVIEGILAEGLVHIRNMDSDYFQYNESTYTLTGQHTGKTYRLGDVVKVKVTRVNMEEKQLDFVLV